jgi:ribosomal protein L3 glutamine methyltransferase
VTMDRELTVAESIECVAVQFEAAGLYFGHGTDNPRDEAAWLVLHVISAPLDGSFLDWGRGVSAAEAADIRRLAEARCSSGQPLAYLTGVAYFAGLEFEVTPDVLVPRSPIAELISDEFRPWAEPDQLRRVLDLCTGSGCVAIATAVRLPRARIEASDISAAALRVAKRNLARHGVDDRVRLVQSDLF